MSFLAAIADVHVQELLAATARLASAHAREVAAALAAAVSGLDAEQFPAACVRAAEQLLAQHLDLLFGQHLAPLVACCVYGVAKCLDVAVSFRVRARVARRVAQRQACTRWLCAR